MSAFGGTLNRPVMRYAIAVPAVGIALLLRQSLVGLVGELPHYVTFYPAVMLVAILAGVGPGLFATALAAVAAAYWIIPPHDSFLPMSLNDAIGLGLFSGMGLFMTLVAELYRHSRWRAAIYEKELAVREEQARAAVETERQRQLLAVTLASIGDGVVVTDTQGRVTFLNAEAERLTGWSSSEASGRQLAEVFKIINEQTRQAVENPADKVLRLGTTVGLANHTVLLTRDGREIPIDDSGAPVRSADGTVHGVVLVFRDFTEKKRVEALLRARLRLSELVQHASIDELIQTALDEAEVLTDSCIGYFHLVDADQQNLTLQAWSTNTLSKMCQAEGKGRHYPVCRAGVWVDCLHARAPVIHNDYASLAHKKGMPAGHAPVVRDLGVPVLRGDRVLAIIGVGNKATDYTQDNVLTLQSLAIPLMDLVEYKRTEEALLETKVAAEAANEAKGRFLANVSHELRTPMNAILGMVDLALPKQADSTAREFLQTARESADLLLALLDDLLDSAKIESGKLELESAPFSLHQVLDQIARVLATRASEKGVCFSCKIPSEVPDGLVGDQIRLRQVLLNLAGNGIKFTESGEVAVAVRVESQHGEEVCLEFAVRDTGIGISPSDVDRIFEPFTQADPSTTRRFAGTGLGLTICASLVHMMGGHIWVASKPEEGSTFYFTVRLPLAKEVPPKPETADVLTAAPARLRLLLVEDNPANQKVAAYILRERGHTVDIVGDGQQALCKAQEDCYDVILMDVQMPNMDGLETTKAIRVREKGNRRVPIVAMTAHAMKGDRENCLAAGMDDYLSKPIDGYEMVTVVERLAAGSPSAVVDVGPFSPDGKESAGLSSTAIFDPALALKQCLGKQDLLAQMIQFFFSDVEKLLPTIRSALEQGDLTEVGKLGHRLKGTISHLAAERAREAALRLERIGLGGCQQTEAEEVVQVLERECEVLRQALSASRWAVSSAKSE